MASNLLLMASNLLAMAFRFLKGAAPAQVAGKALDGGLETCLIPPT